ncbi:arsenite efflux membrane protein ArsB [Paenibacillus cellulosilyticus]|uniref:Arsenical pump membrane protein n=1 Tax=Paenibacillus cellulosilyticus TaxID=375489 RepID=A0A2V2Z6V6_9BACL|nr:arsenic transporter [Paenibacillus cellulosilyticus]PWW06580.1 arsenite efflux membrane protein ArsB [Paenibacillus cellulosilyticus]QKS46089.1 arsenic transporter [Paenibacillus cellulosilyticus]
MGVLAPLLFALTVSMVIWQPRKLNIGWSASGGALIAVILGIVGWRDIVEVTSIVWNATFTFIGIIIISIVLDEIGFFEWSALHMARLARGSGRRLFVYMVLLGAGVSVFFANDGAALILTPIVLATVRALNMKDRMVLPFVMACGFIADTASVPLIISNLVNIVAADFFGVGFAQYAGRMIIPGLFSIGASLLVVYLYYRRSIGNPYSVSDLPEPNSVIKDMRLFKLSWIILAVLMAAYMSSEWLSVPVCVIAGIASAALLLAARRSPHIKTSEIMKQAPWSIVVFSIGMYVVVYGLRNVGLTDHLADLLQWFADQGLFVASIGGGFVAAILSSIMNNLPTVMIDALATADTETTGAIREALIFSNIIGSDLGPKMTPIGSLATLIWLHVLSRKGVTISWLDYMKTGIVLTIPVLFITLCGLYVWLLILH